MSKKTYQKTEQTNTNKADCKAVPGSDVRTDPADVVDTLKTRCFEIAEDYINNLRDPEEIYKNNGLFVDMLKNIYDMYLRDVIKNDKSNGNRYDFIQLDKIFNIYTSLVYAYKQNKRASIIEFTVFIKISRDTLYHAAMGMTQKLTTEESNIVKNWFIECENTLTNNSSVFDMFLLKSHPVYRYNDNLSPVPLASQGSIMAVNELPDLSGGASSGIAKIANNGQNDPDTRT